MIPCSVELLHLIQTLCRALECWIRRWLKEKAAVFPVTWFLKLAGYIMPLWEEGIAVFVSEPVTVVIGKRKSRLVRFVTHSGALNSPQACFIIRFQSRKYFRCRLANSLSLKKTWPVQSHSVSKSHTAFWLLELSLVPVPPQWQSNLLLMYIYSARRRVRLQYELDWPA